MAVHRAYFHEMDELFRMEYRLEADEQNHHYRGDFHTHETYEIYYFQRGECQFWVGEEIYSLQPGDILILDGQTLHRAVSNKDTPFMRTIIQLHPDYIKQITRWLPIDLLQPFYELKNVCFRLAENSTTQLEAVLINLHRGLSNQNKQLGRTKQQLLLLELLYIIYEASPLDQESDSPREQSKKYNHSKRIHEFINSHYCEEDICLERIAQGTYLSEKYLSKIFKEMTGTSVMYYVNRKRITKAKLMMMTEKCTITDISYSVGFKYPAHFSRVFKKVTGMTAESYRKLHGAAK